MAGIKTLSSADFMLSNNNELVIKHSITSDFALRKHFGQFFRLSRLNFILSKINFKKSALDLSP